MAPVDDEESVEPVVVVESVGLLPPSLVPVVVSVLVVSLPATVVEVVDVVDEVDEEVEDEMGPGWEVGVAGKEVVVVVSEAFSPRAWMIAGSVRAFAAPTWLRNQR